MARTDTLGNFLTDVADAIRTKKGTTDVILANTFDTEIANLPNSGGEDINNYFHNTIKASSNINVTNGVNVIIKKIPNDLTISGTSCAGMFQYCISLKTIPQLDTSNIYNMSKIFFQCISLVEIPLLNASNVTNLTNAFAYCSSITDMKGLKDLGQAYSTSLNANNSNCKLDLSACTSLTEQSIINVLNGLYDIATKGCNTQSVVLGTTNLEKLTSEEGQAALTNATAKGWTVS